MPNTCKIAPRAITLIYSFPRVSNSPAKHPESADRPKWSALDNRMLRCTVGNDVRDWKEALACFFEHWDGENGMK